VWTWPPGGGARELNRDHPSVPKAIRLRPANIGSEVLGGSRAFVKVGRQSCQSSLHLDTCHSATASGESGQRSQPLDRLGDLAVRSGRPIEQ
jgi:hypothetical protein